jgi:hypothetical protein
MLMGGVAGMGAGRMQAQNGKLALAAPVTYNNRYEVYGGLQYSNFQAGQNVPKLMNLGGAEISGTYWLTSRWGGVLDYRGAAGTTAVVPNPLFNGRALVYQNAGLAGVQYRSIHTQRAALNFHAYGGVSHGVFDHTLPTSESGLYTNRTKPVFALGGSVDINRSKNLAIRLSPDLILEHYGTETREFFALSGGVIYRFGSR